MKHLSRTRAHVSAGQPKNQSETEASIAGEIGAAIFGAISREADTGDDGAAIALHCLRQWIVTLAEAVAEVEKKPGDAKALESLRESADDVSREFAAQLADAASDGQSINLLKLREGINEALARLKAGVFLSEKEYAEGSARIMNPTRLDKDFAAVVKKHNMTAARFRRLAALLARWARQCRKAAAAMARDSN